MIKPSGVSYDVMKVDDMVVVDLASGEVIEGTKRPSSDTATHRALYLAWPEVGGIVHTHSRHATIWAQAGRAIPAWGTTHADDFYGEIPCTRAMRDEEIQQQYEWNTGEVIIETFAQRGLSPTAIPAVLVNSHGPLRVGQRCPCGGAQRGGAGRGGVYGIVQSAADGRSSPIQQTLLDLHYLRKHGENAWYGQK